MRLLASLLAGLAITTLAATASAYGNGATGYTGKQEGRSCTSCHQGGTPPAVTIEGPDSLAAGATGDYTMVITTNQRGAGGVASSTGTLAAGTGFQLQDGELTHSASIASAGGKATFKFQVTAPANGTTLKLFAVGMSANGSGTGGDGVKQITKDVTITGGGAEPTTPPPPTTPPADDDDDAADQATPGSTSTSTDATEPSSAKKTTKKKKKTADDEEDEDDGYRRDAFGATDSQAACSMHAGKVDSAGAGAAVLLGLALLGGRRRRRA